jgi:hypothetical protein
MQIENGGIMRTSRIFLTVLLLTALGGCASVAEHSDSSSRSPVVWADDDSEFAIALEDQQESGKSAGSSPYRHRIIVQETDGKGRKSVTTTRPYRVGALYYMKRAGYLIVESLLDDGHVKIDRIALQGGGEIPIIETKGPLNPCEGEKAFIPTQVLPAPDGSRLAFAYSPVCGEVVIEFLDGRTLIAEDSLTIPLTGTAALTWHPDGYLLLAQNSEARAWRLQPGMAVAEAPYPPCLTPPTSSSAIATDGREAWLDGEVAKAREGARERAFGCQRGEQNDD